MSKSIGPALELGGNLAVLLCFTLYLREISKYKLPGGLYLKGLIFEILRYIKTRHYKHWQRKAFEDQGEDGHYRSVIMVFVLLRFVCSLHTV